MDVFGQPVTLNSKLYIKVWSKSLGATAILEYTPSQDKWSGLPPPPVIQFTLASVMDQLFVVGGMDAATEKIVNTLYTYDEHSLQWSKSKLAMPTAQTLPAAIGYQDHLIVAGGWSSNDSRVSDVNILDLTSNKCKIAQSLPKTDLDAYYPALVNEMLYLVGGNTQTVLRAYVPTLISGAMVGVWETVRNAPYYWSAPVAIGNTVLVMGGQYKSSGDKIPSSSIHMYDPTTGQWTKVGELPEPMDKTQCVVINSELFVLNSTHNHCSVLFSKLFVVY